MKAALVTEDTAAGSGVKIQSASPEDATAIMNLKRAAWLAAYPNAEHGISIEDIQQKFTDGMLAEGIANWQTGIAQEKDGGNRRTFVAKLADRVVGFTSPYIEDDGQRRLGALYVAPDYQHRGIGSKLLQQALAWHGDDQDVYLHVVSYNLPAISLYQKFGFHKTGKDWPEEFDPKQDIKLLPEVEMRRPGKSS